MNRRDIIKAASGIGAIASVWYGANETEWLRSVSSKRPVQTEQQYVDGLPERTEGNDGRLLVELARTPEEAEQLFGYELIPLPYRDQLRSGYGEGFWVAFATGQDYESSFHPGRWQL